MVAYFCYHMSYADLSDLYDILSAFYVIRLLKKKNENMFLPNKCYTDNNKISWTRFQKFPLKN